MKPRLLRLVFVMTCLGYVTPFCDAQKQVGKRPYVPRIARLLGVRVGYNGQHALERTLGEGLHATGGHPNSRQLWRTRWPNGAIETDGFSLNDEGYIIESLEWTTCDSGNSDRSIPRARKMPRRSGWLGVISLGMTRREVTRLTEGRLPPPTKKGNTWSWKAKGFMVPKFAQLQDAYQQWTATLEFEHGRVTSMRVDCE
jgi:hypothetical protein